MSKPVSQKTPTEEFAQQFVLPEPSRKLRQDILAEARSAWATQTGTRRDSLRPYFVALAATVLMIFTVNTLGRCIIDTGDSAYVVTVRPGQRAHVGQDLTLNLPDKRHLPLNIVGLSHVPYKTHFAQLRIALTQGDAL